MIKIIGNDIIQNGTKIGYIKGDDIYNANGNKVGSYLGNDIFDYNRNKIGYIQGDYIKYDNGNRSISLKETKMHISGGTIPDICRAAIKLLFGD